MHEDGATGGIRGEDARLQGSDVLSDASRVPPLPAVAVICTGTRGFVFRIEVGLDAGGRLAALKV